MEKKKALIITVPHSKPSVYRNHYTDTMALPAAEALKSQSIFETILLPSTVDRGYTDLNRFRHEPEWVAWHLNFVGMIERLKSEGKKVYVIDMHSFPDGPNPVYTLQSADARFIDFADALSESISGQPSQGGGENSIIITADHHGVRSVLVEVSEFYFTKHPEKLKTLASRIISFLDKH